MLVDGRIEGVWEQDKKRKQTVVTVSMFDKVSNAVKKAIEAEIVRLGKFLSSEVEVVYG